MSTGKDQPRRLRFDPAVSTARGPLVAHWFTASPATTSPVTEAMARTRDWLLASQADDGHWVGELEGDSILESEYVLLLAWLDSTGSAPDWAAERIARCAARIRDQQLPGGGWAIYPGGPLEISASVKAWYALKIAGDSTDDPGMRLARDAITAAGGAERINSFTRYYLALLGVIAYDQCPAVPPELVLLPRWVPLNIYEMSAWSRTIVVPLSLLWAFRPTVAEPLAGGIDELFIRSPETLPASMAPSDTLDGTSGHSRFNWSKVFNRIDRAWKRIERWGLKPFRGIAVRRAADWMTRRLAGSDGLGAIFPPMIWSVVALKCLGYDDDSPEVTTAIDELERLVLSDGAADRLQPCLSPVWDTAITTIALRDAGVPAAHPALKRAVRWLLNREVRQPGDWSVGRRAPQPSGWFFEYRNRFYPDVDDSAMVLIALTRCLPELPWSAEFFLDGGLPSDDGPDIAAVLSGRTERPESAADEVESMQPVLRALHRGARWVLSMQSRDGGWGAFDRDNNRELLTRVPFADHNAMIDPSTADLTARVLETLAGLGVGETHAAVQKAIGFLWDRQEDDGCWYGRWGVNCIYGTWQVLVGLTALGVPADDPRLRKAADWLREHQQPAGSWGESPRSYDDPSLRGRGPATASQTAWAVMGLLAAGEFDSESVRRGIEYLLETQQSDGTWAEPWFTGTGFPRVFYLKYHLYRIYFPLMALSRYHRLAEH